MSSIDDFVSVEEEGKECDEPSHSSSLTLTLATSPSLYEMLDHSLMNNQSTITHFGVQALDKPVVPLELKSPVNFDSKLPDVQAILQTLLIQANNSDLTNALSSSFESDRRLHAITKSLRFLIHSVHALNQKIIRDSWKRSFLNLDGEVERDTLEEVYVYAGEADPSVNQAPLEDFRDIPIRCALKRNLNLESQVMIVKWKLVPASSYESSATISVPQTIQIEYPSRSIVICSGFDSNDENARQAPEPELLYIQSILRILLVQSYPLVLTNAPSMSIELYHRLRAATKSQRFSVCSVCTKDLDVIHAFSRRSILNFDDEADYCVSDDGYLHAEEVNPPLAHVSVEEFHDIPTQHARKWDFGYLTGIFELKPVPASSYDFSTTISVPQTIQIENPSRSMLICSEFDLNVENVQQAPDLALIHEGSEESWMTMSTPALDSNLMGVELSPRLQLRNLISYSDLSAKVVAFIQPSLTSQGEHIDYNFSVLLPAPVCKNDARRVCPLFIYLVIWAPKNYIAGAAQNFYVFLPA